MRLVGVCLALAVVVGLSRSARAQTTTVDLTTITCKQLTGEDEDTSVTVLAILYGFLLGKENKKTLDITRIENESEKFWEVCEQRPDATVMSVATETLSR